MKLSWTNPKDRPYLDQCRYQAHLEYRRKMGRTYYKANKKKMRSGQDKFWKTIEGWLIIKKSGWKRDGFTPEEIKKKIKKFLKDPRRDGKKLRHHHYIHRRKL